VCHYITLPQQLKVTEDSSNSIEIKEILSDDLVDTKEIIQQVDEQLTKIQETVYKPDTFNMETLTAESVRFSGSEKPADMKYSGIGKPTKHGEESDEEKQSVVTGMKKCVVEESGLEKHDVNQPGVVEHDVQEVSTENPSMEIPSMENPSMEIPSMENPSMEIPSMENPSMETPSMENPSMEISNMEKPDMKIPSTEEAGMEDSVMKDEASMEDKTTGEDTSVLTNEMDSVETTGEGSFIDESTGPSSLEGMDRTQGMICYSLVASTILNI